MSAYTDTLRAFADWLDAHPGADEEAMLTSRYVDGEIPCRDGWRVLDARGFTADGLRDLARQIGGRWEKDVDDTYFWLRQEILPGVIYELYANRAVVCTARVVGTETVEVPDPDAPTIRVERDVIEWDCPDSLAAVA